MIALSENLMDYLKDNFKILNENGEISEDELEKVTSLSVSKKDIEYLHYFKNVDTLVLESFPSIDSNDILEITKVLSDIRSLKIKEQSALISLDVSKLNKLEELCIIHNDNLESISGIDKVKRFTFYDNKDFMDVQQIVDLLHKNKESNIILDIIYYVDIVRKLCEQDEDVKLLDNFTWVESVGLRKYIIHEYTKDEIFSLIQNVSSIISKNIYVTDGDIEKFGILYRWMVENIDFVNEDDPKGEDVEVVSNIYKVFNYQKGGRLSFAKAFQLLLSFAGVKSSVVYSLGALETIGYYNGQKVYSLLGTSDYALLRVSIDDRYYYCDIAWDSMVSDYKYFDELRLFLVSKEELKLRHKFVGEGNIEKSYSYHGDDSDDLIMFANDRLKEVIETFADIERLKPSMLGVEMNAGFLKKDISEKKKKLETLEKESEEYKELVRELAISEENLNEEESSLLRYKNMRDGIIESYSNLLISHYINNSEKDKEEILKELEKNKNVCLISTYMYEILCESLKAA